MGSAGELWLCCKPSFPEFLRKPIHSTTSGVHAASGVVAHLHWQGVYDVQGRDVLYIPALHIIHTLPM